MSPAGVAGGCSELLGRGRDGRSTLRPEGHLRVVPCTGPHGGSAAGTAARRSGRPCVGGQPQAGSRSCCAWL